MSPDIIQILATLGVIAQMWRMTSEIGKLTAQMRNYVNRTEDHETRLRTLEKKPYAQTRVP